MKKKTWIVMILAACLLLYGLGSIFYNSFFIDINSRPLTGAATHGTDILLEDFTNETEIRFGILAPNWGNKLKREVINDKDYSVEVELKIFGTIKPLVDLNPEEKFVLGPGENKTYTLIFLPTEQTAPGDYTGELKIIKKRLLW